MANIKIEGLKPRTDYQLHVVAKNDDGSIRSAPSNIISFTTIGDDTAPDAPTSLGLDFSTTTMSASWNGTAARIATDFLDYSVVITKPASSASQIFYTNNNFFYFTLDQNRKLFGETTPSASLIVSVRSRDTSGNESSAVTSSVVNPPPSVAPTVTYTSILKGFAATWTAPTFADYAYTGISISNTTPFSASDGGGNSVWKGNANSYEYSQNSLYNQLYVQALFYDVFNQPGPNSNTGSVTPIAPITVDTNPPSNATGLTITASNSGGATGMDGYIKVNWTESTASDQRGTRLRFRAQGDQYYQYENSASGNSSYQINNLIPGYTYEVAIATYDEINNTSSFLFASPSAITIPFSTLPSLTTTASGITSSSNIAISGTVYASYVGQVVSGWGLYPGTRITASYSGSVGVSPSPASAFSGSTVSFYPGVANWQSYITAGLPASYMKIGTGVNGTQHGIWLDNNNYWYTTGNFRVGSNTSYFSWDGVTASISGDLRAYSGSFLGNVNVASAGSIYAGSNPSSGARVIFNASGVIGYNSSNINTFVLDATTGNFSASNAFISGSVKADSGSVGAWNITASYLSRTYLSGTKTLAVGLTNNFIQNHYGINLDTSTFNNSFLIREDGTAYFGAGDGSQYILSVDTSSTYRSNNKIQFGYGFYVDSSGNLTSTGTNKINGTTFRSIDYGTSSMNFISGAAGAAGSASVNIQIARTLDASTIPAINLTPRGTQGFPILQVSGYYVRPNGAGTVYQVVPPLGSIASATINGTTVRVTTTASTGLLTGDYVRIENTGNSYIDSSYTDGTVSASITTSASTSSSFTFTAPLASTASVYTGNWYSMIKSFSVAGILGAATSASNNRLFHFIAIL